MTRLGRGRRLRILTWNCKVGRDGRKVRRAVKRMARWHRPKVIVLQEARPYRDELATLGGFTLYTPKGKSGEAGNCVTLIRDPWRARPVRVLMRVLRMRTPWIGPKAGKHHDGRRFVEVSRDWWTVVNVHRTRPQWSEDGRAFAEEYEALLESARSCSTPVWVCVGDQNIGTRPDDRRLKHSPWQLARMVGADVFTTGPGHIDYAIARGVDDGWAKRLGTHGSDHHAALIVLKVRPTSV